MTGSMSATRLGGFAAALALSGAALSSFAQGQQSPAQHIAATIDVHKPSAPVSKYQYGMFIEHIGELIYRGLWAEMLDDRKFYYPVRAEGKDPKTKPSLHLFPGMTPRKWRPIGDDEAVAMDTHDAFVGEQSPKVALSGASARGLQQAGLALLQGKDYVGHLVVSGTPTARVKVALVWGEGAAGRQVIAIPVLGHAWRSVPLKFSAGADATDGRLEITGTGVGTFRVGAASLMPADNVQGWRADTTALLRSLHSGMWRLPGGNFLSDHDWHDAIGPRDTRQPTYDYAWDAMQTNDVGMDEFMTLCRLLNVEPYVTVNAGFGDAHSAAELVEYANAPVTSMWGAVRERNGHPAPYEIKYWNIGNEPYGSWQLGHTTLKYFVLKHNEFARAMRKVDPSIILLGSGAMPDQMKPEGVKENPTLDGIQPKFGTDQDWTGGLLANSWGYFDGLTEHWYDKAEQRPDAPSNDELLEFARQPSNQVRMKATEWEEYENRFPAMKAKGMSLWIDEYAYTGAPANLKSALAYSMVLQEMLRHTDFLRMSAFTMGTSTLDITPTASVLNSTGEVFKLYADHFGADAIPIEVSGSSPQPAARYPVGFDHPEVNAGSPTYPLDVVAALSPDRSKLLIAVVNATQTAQPLDILVSGAPVHGQGKLWQLMGANLDASNKVNAPAGVTIQQSQVAALGDGLTVPPISANVYEFSVAGAASGTRN
jgi:alpha-N-arabinofuranosidase